MGRSLPLRALLSLEAMTGKSCTTPLEWIPDLGASKGAVSMPSRMALGTAPFGCLRSLAKPARMALTMLARKSRMAMTFSMPPHCRNAGQLAWSPATRRSSERWRRARWL